MKIILHSDVERHQQEMGAMSDEKAAELRESLKGNREYVIKEDGSIWQITLEDILIRLEKLEKKIG